MCSTLKDVINSKLLAFITGSNGQTQRPELETAARA